MSDNEKTKQFKSVERHDSTLAREKKNYSVDDELGALKVKIELLEADKKIAELKKKIEKLTQDNDELGALKAKVELLEMEKRNNELKRKINKPSLPEKDLSELKNKRISEINLKQPLNKPINKPIHTNLKDKTLDSKDVKSKILNRNSEIKSNIVSSSDKSLNSTISKTAIVDNLVHKDIENAQHTVTGAAIQKKRSIFLRLFAKLFWLVFVISIVYGLYLVGGYLFYKVSFNSITPIYKNIFDIDINESDYQGKETLFPYSSTFISVVDKNKIGLKQDYINLENYLALKPTIVIDGNAKNINNDKKILSVINGMLQYKVENPGYNLSLENTYYKKYKIQKLSIKKNIFTDGYHIYFDFIDDKNENYKINFDVKSNLLGLDISNFKLRAKINPLKNLGGFELVMSIDSIEWLSSGSIKSLSKVNTTVTSKGIRLNIISEKIDFDFLSNGAFHFINNNLQGNIIGSTVEGNIESIFLLDTGVNFKNSKNINIQFQNEKIKSNITNFFLNNGELKFEKINFESTLGNGEMFNFKYDGINTSIDKFSSQKFNLQKFTTFLNGRSLFREGVVNIDSELVITSDKRMLENLSLMVGKTFITNSKITWSDTAQMIEIGAGTINLDELNMVQKNINNENMVIRSIQNMISSIHEEDFKFSLETENGIIFNSQELQGGKIKIQYSPEKIEVVKFILGNEDTHVRATGAIKYYDDILLNHAQSMNFSVRVKNIDLQNIEKVFGNKLNLSGKFDFVGSVKSGAQEIKNFSFKGLDVLGKASFYMIDINNFNLNKKVCSVLINNGDAIKNSKDEYVANKFSFDSDIEIKNGELGMDINSKLKGIDLNGSLKYTIFNSRINFDGKLGIAVQTPACNLSKGSELVSIFSCDGIVGEDFDQKCTLSYTKKSTKKDKRSEDILKETLMKNAIIINKKSDVNNNEVKNKPEASKPKTTISDEALQNYLKALNKKAQNLEKSNTTEDIKITNKSSNTAKSSTSTTSTTLPTQKTTSTTKKAETTKKTDRNNQGYIPE